MVLTFIANHCTAIFFHLLIYYNQPHCRSHGSANIDVAFSISELELQMHRVALLTTNLKTILFIYCTNSQQKLSYDTDDTCYAYYRDRAVPQGQALGDEGCHFLFKDRTSVLGGDVWKYFGFCTVDGELNHKGKAFLSTL